MILGADENEGNAKRNIAKAWVAAWHAALSNRGNIGVGASLLVVLAGLSNDDPGSTITWVIVGVAAGLTLLYGSLGVLAFRHRYAEGTVSVLEGLRVTALLATFCASMLTGAFAFVILGTLYGGAFIPLLFVSERR